jgi:hypothetical protein
MLMGLKRREVLIESSVESVSFHVERTVNLGNFNSIKVGLQQSYTYAKNSDIPMQIQHKVFTEDTEQKFEELLKAEVNKFSIGNTSKIVHEGNSEEFFGNESTEI